MSDVKYSLPPPNVVHSSCHPPPPPPAPLLSNDNDNNNNNFDFLSQHVSSNLIHDVDNRYLEQQEQQQSVHIATTNREHLATTTTTARGTNQDEDPELAMARRNRPLSFSSLSRDEAEKSSGGSGSSIGDGGSSQRQVISISTPDPSHLFWVPATQHPEIAPAEFEKFLQMNAMAKRERASLRRRSSILSVSFTASDAEQEQEEGVARDQLQQLSSNNTSDTSGEQHDQGLNENESQRKTRLRRSISLGTISAAENQMRLPDFLVFDRNSSTEDQSRVLVPRADRSSLLRRGARTRFQRNSSFTPSAPRRPVDRHRQAESMPPVPFNRDIQSLEGITLSDKPLQEDQHLISRPETEKDDEHIQSLAVGENVTTTPSSTPPITPSSSISEPTFQRQQQQQQPSSTVVPSPSPSPSPPPPPAPPSHAIDRGEKKSSWSWGFRKNKSDQLKQEPVMPASSPSPPPAAPEPRPSVSTDSTSTSKKFGLSSLFSRKGSSSKVQPANASMVPTNAAGVNGTAVPKDFQLNRINQNRLPIHIERAIYRLSHTKLANPRRPLHEQVLISNLMFWYLSVVSSTQPNGSVEAGRKFVNAGKKGKKQPQQQQQNRPNKTSNHRPSQQQQQQQNAALHQYMGNNASTGFVIPENYLRPKGGGGPKHRKPSLSDSDDDDDDDDSSSSDSSSDEETTTRKAHTMTSKSSTRPNTKGPSLITHTQSARKERDDDIPLAMYKSKGRV